MTLIMTRYEAVTGSICVDYWVSGSAVESVGRLLGQWAGCWVSGSAADFHVVWPRSASMPNVTMRLLSDTSSFSNDTVRFTSFFVYNGDRICLISQ